MEVKSRWIVVGIFTTILMVVILTGVFFYFQENKSNVILNLLYGKNLNVEKQKATNIKSLTDVTKVYNSTIEQIIIKDNSSKAIAKLRLITPRFFNVLRGKDRMVAEFTIENFNDYVNVFGDVRFYDVEENMSEINREFVYKYKIYYDIEVIDYETVCNEREVWDDGNKTFFNESYDCFDNKTGSHFEETFNWSVFDKNAPLLKGNITIGIFSDVFRGETIDWFPNLFGIRIDEWAEWNESFEVGLINYWTFDNTMNDSISGENFTNFGGEFIPGKNNEGFNVSVLAYATTVEDHSISGNTNRTISFWGQYNSLSGPNFFKLVAGGASGIAGLFNIGSLLGEWHFQAGGLGQEFDFGSSDTEVHHHVITYNGTGVTWFLDGVESSGNKQIIDTNTGKLSISFELTEGGGSNNVSVNVDEMAFWDRTLSNSEILDLYNNGTGIFLPADTCGCAGLNNNWEIDHADVCVISDPCDLGTGKLSFIGTGITTCQANIKTSDLGDPGSGGTLQIDSSCLIEIS